MVLRLYIGLILIVLIFQCCTEQTPSDQTIEIKEVWIPMSDGTQLAADLYLPQPGNGSNRYPVLLEYLPYRKDEHRKLRYPVFSYFVQRGYIIARVDIRGTGRSEGKLIAYEYTEQEKKDGLEVIDWLSRQSFSTGSIGMFGISWGGFNAIQIAMRQPPALKAILAMMATDDIYEDDVHFIDGMMHIDSYEIGRDIKNIIPGAPDYSIEGNYFEEKFDTEPWLLIYKRNQRDSDFWDQGSLNHDYASLQTPIFMISGWYDGYRDSTPRILKKVTAPKKAIVGPWNHTFPHMAEPPPATEWRFEAVRWFDHWLKGADNGIMDEPTLAVYIRENHGPGQPDSIPGYWEWIEDWPSNDIVDSLLFLSPGQLTGTSSKKVNNQSLAYHPSAGIQASGSVMWWGDWSPDISKSDSSSLVFETEPLEKDIVILGLPKLKFNASLTGKQAHFIARLSDVSPNQNVTLITGAGLNGTHRNSSKEPEPLEPGTTYPLEIEMHFTSWTFKKGHKIRLSISNGQWPMVWPNPSTMEMTMELGGEDPSFLSLPLFKGTEGNDRPAFKLPANDPELKGYQTTKYGTISGFAEISETKYLPETGITQVIASNSWETVYPWSKWTNTEEIIHQVVDEDPAKTSVESTYSITIETTDRVLTWTGILDFSSDKDNFYYSYIRNLTEGDSLLRTRAWKETIPRDFQ